MLALYICYYFAISKTYERVKEYQNQKTLLSKVNSSPNYLQLLKQKDNQLNQLLISQNSFSSISNQNDLLKFLNEYSLKFDVKIIDFKEPHSNKINELVETNYNFTLQGSYNGIISLLNQIENKPTVGFIKHVHFTKRRNYKTNLDELLVEIVLTKS